MRRRPRRLRSARCDRGRDPRPAAAALWPCFGRARGVRSGTGEYLRSPGHDRRATRSTRRRQGTVDHRTWGRRDAYCRRAGTFLHVPGGRGRRLRARAGCERRGHRRRIGPQARRCATAFGLRHTFRCQGPIRKHDGADTGQADHASRTGTLWGCSGLRRAESLMNAIDALMRGTPVIPVLVIDDVATARPIAEALAAGGLTTLEVTLRTPAALAVITEIAKVEGVTVGAGTVLNQHDMDASIRAGARFIVSPGLTEPLARAAITRDVPFLPGVASASDIMRGLDLGLDRFKFFPAEAAGGIKALRALAAPFRQCRFCPTGGITPATAADWLALDSVLCVGGSWLIPDDLEPAEIQVRARWASSLRRLSAGR
ncbi:aldolase, putative [Ricinus communis]|uniref:2-dehydro-3-deoxy-phosphogluconate aldolase n=1 Tax=Ricinus communis TaxID=3988 RepID=B9TC23_RICCO|nr:aldolase, putative [Ricinus communis]